MSFDTALEFYLFIMACNRGSGLSVPNTARLLKFLHAQGLDLSRITDWHSKTAALKYGRSIGLSGRTYMVREVHIEGWPRPFYVRFTSPIQALRGLFGDQSNSSGFQLWATPQIDASGNLLFTTPSTASFWMEAQAHVPDDEVICPVILASDQTTLDGTMRTRIWPLYISTANIPWHRRWHDAGKLLLAILPEPNKHMLPMQKVELFQKSLGIVLHELHRASKNPVDMVDPWGVSRKVRPLLYAYIGDYPETCRVSCTLSLKSSKPCSLCYISRKRLRQTDTRGVHLRTVAGQSKLLRSEREAHQYSTIPILSALWEINFSEEPWGNTYLSMMPDILHVFYLGVWKHLVTVLISDKDIAKIYEERYLRMYPDAHLAGLPAPIPGKYFISSASYTGAEHSGMMLSLS
ncbi:hypothetical protein CLOM_g2576 [Closterium sp. NIES-68]|nr:hypothetical protein CLOM_g2576 [Closterium sp. NIES-68]